MSSNELDIVVYEIDESYMQDKGLAIEGLGYMEIAYEESERVRQEIQKKEESIDLDDFEAEQKVGKVTVYGSENAEIEWNEEV